MKTSNKLGVVYLSSYSAIFMITGYVINILLARLLGPVEYGDFGVILSLVSTLNLIASAGFPQAASKFISADLSKTDSVFKSTFILQLIIILILSALYAFLADDLAYLFNDKSLTPYLILSSASVPFYGLFMLYSGLYNGLHFFGKQSAINIVYSLTRAVLIVILAYFFQLTGAILGFIIAPIVSLFVGFRIPNFKVSSFSYKRLIIFSLPLICFAFLSMLLQSVDLYLIKALLNSPESPGYYSANQNISRIPYYALSAFYMILLPNISKNISENQIERARNIISRSLRLIFIFLIPGTLLIAITNKQIIQFVYSNSYIPGASSLSLLIFSYGFLSIFTVFANILNGAGSPYKSTIISALGVLTMSICSVIFIPKFGLIGAALSSTIGNFIIMLISAYYIYKQFNTLVSLKTIVNILIASSLISLVAYIIILPQIFLPLFYIFLFFLYLFFLFFLKEITKDDVAEVKNLLPNWLPIFNK